MAITPLPPLSRVLVAAASVAVVVGIAGACAHYTPAPVDPQGELAPYAAARLDDPGLRRWLDSLGAAVDSAGWTPRELALAGDFFQPGRRRWEAQLEEGRAGLVTAGTRPQPGASTDVEYAFSNAQASSRWGLALASLFTLELGGKRDARLARARAAQLELAAQVMGEQWSAANRVYRATVGVTAATRRAGALERERLLLDSVADLARDRYGQGSLSRLELARIEGEARAGEAEASAAARERDSTRAVLAATVGVPPPALVRVPLRDTPWTGCQLLPDSAVDSLRRQALGASWTLRESAAAYQVAEGNLRIEVARATPDLTLGPGLFFDQGTGKFTVGLGLPTLPFNRNRGPIAQAEAARQAAGAQVAEVQREVLSRLDAAVAACHRATAAVQDRLQVADQAADRARLAQAAYRRGETGRLEVAVAQLEQARAERQTVEAEAQVGLAAQGLEQALGAWGRRADGSWPVPVVSPTE